VAASPAAGSVVLEALNAELEASPDCSLLGERAPRRRTSASWINTSSVLVLSICSRIAAPNLVVLDGVVSRGCVPQGGLAREHDIEQRFPHGTAESLGLLRVEGEIKLAKATGAHVIERSVKHRRQVAEQAPWRARLR
jgi:hypothetical protein